MTTFAERLRLLMYEKDLNRSQVARRLGVAVSTVHRWFVRDSVPNIETIEKLADLFGVSDMWLRGLTEDRNAGKTFEDTQPAETETDTIKEDDLDEEIVRLIRGLNPQQLQRVRDFLAGLRG
jgi:transcriptional regulator with XRE-family HTH domain